MRQTDNSMKHICFALICGLMLLAACKQKKDEAATPAQQQTEAPEAAGENPEALLNKWNRALAAADSATLMSLYADTVWYYGQRKSGAGVVSAKLKALRSMPGFGQRTIETAFDKRGDSIFCKFVKVSYFKNASNKIPATLTLAGGAGNWKIVAESDSAADARIARFKNMSIPEDAVEGDYDGDGAKEAVWLAPPKIKEEEMECEGPCTARIRFSSPLINAFAVENCIGGRPHNLGDLNGDGADEIGVLHEWFTSCWKGYDVFTYKDGKWRTLVPTISTHCNQWEEGVIPAEKDPNKPGYVLIHYSEMTDDDLVTKTKSVKVN